MRRALGTLAAAASLAACGGTHRPVVDVLAASSFTDVSAPLEALVERELGVEVRFSFGSSGAFLEQLRQGAPASVVVTADTPTMRQLEIAGLVDPSVAIATNRLVVVTADTAAGRSIEALSDLATTDGIVVLCAASAPCGAASDELLAGEALNVSPASREPNVRATLTKVLLGEADAALVYATDALAHPELRSIPVGGDVVVTAHAAAVADDERGAAVVAVLAGADAGEILRRAGFGAP